MKRSITGGNYNENGNLYYYLDPCDGRPDISLNDDINCCKTRRMKVGTKFKTISSSTLYPAHLATPSLSEMNSFLTEILSRSKNIMPLIWAI